MAVHSVSAFDLQTFDFLTVFSYTTGEMLPFQERKKFRKFLYSKANILVLLVLVVLAARGAWHMYEKAAIARAERAESLKALAEVEDRKAALETSLERLKSAQGVEEELRQKFTVARPGEEVVVVVDADAKKGKNGSGAQEKSFWQRLASFFVGE